MPMPRSLLPLVSWALLVLLSGFSVCSADSAPYGMRISCGAREDIHTPPTNTLWYKDFAYTGGTPANASRPSFISPLLHTLRYFPVSDGPENCYTIGGVPVGHYSVRIFFGLVNQTNFDDEPLFDISVQGTQISSLQPGWTNKDDQSFAEAIVFLSNGTVSICFHSTGHGDPSILAIEVLQIDDRAYSFGPGWGQGTIQRTVSRLSCGTTSPKFGVDYSGDQWGGDRFWDAIATFIAGSDQELSTEQAIKAASSAPNFYPEGLYQTAIVGTSNHPELEYIASVDSNKNYSIWLHFAEIDSLITGAGQRVFDILINGNVMFQDVDIVKLSGDQYTALVMNTTVSVSGRTLTITLQPKAGSVSLINGIEVLEIIAAESRTSSAEVSALKTLKTALELPVRLGWNGDPCVPQQHPWSGADCQYNSTSNSWEIDGLRLDNQGLRGSLPTEISMLQHLQSINLSGNSIQGTIPSSFGNITSLQILDLSYNDFNGSIPGSLGQLTSLKKLYLNGNQLSGKVPAALGGRLLHGASFNFTDNAGLCGIPGLPTCGPHLSSGAKVGIAFGSCLAFLLLLLCTVCWYKRQQNVLLAQKIAAREAPYAKARTHFSRDIQMARHHNHHNNQNNSHGGAMTTAATESGPILLS
ncbi:hypothetical protein MLD38_027547 [Melastoma candidum]|uniref:Uncharacterized protein n=1 Tax=Melastoma candidum TaxID=119954 RepID=A0ACB9P6M9_9MYRT|nr:hypothetical protein MLD38_027547 [Melastoma candidum]